MESSSASTSGQCPFTGSSNRAVAGRGTRNQDWWPHALRLNILRQHSSLSDPMDEDFDYAIVLKHDDEYRQAVEALPEISDFQQNTEICQENIKYQDEHKFKFVTKEDYGRRITSLHSHKQWAYNEARRSSIGFLGKYAMTEDTVLQNFSHLLTKGVYLRRHRENNEAELIKMYTTNNCEDIIWHAHIRPIPSDDENDDSNEAVENNNENVDNRLGFFQSLMKSFRNEGHFHESDILRVHPAKYEDPTSLGCYGTSTLRNSLDAYDEDLTFSLIF
jgi:hypothetical protein